MSFDNRIRDYYNRGYEVPDHSMIKTPAQIAGIREAGKRNTMVLDYITPFVKEGVSTLELDRLIESYTREIGCIPACLGYQGYPKSVCISVDEVVCHGIPSEEQILKSGDISEIEVMIQEGKFHQIKRMFEAVGKRVLYLKRLSMGPLVLDPSLAPGEWRKLTPEEILSLQAE
jgi:methionyl aminopeptidase